MNIKEKVLATAEKTLYYSNLLIEECGKWIAFEKENTKVQKRKKKRF